jgi:hypothetical protein
MWRTIIFYLGDLLDPWMLLVGAIGPIPFVAFHLTMGYAALTVARRVVLNHGLKRRSVVLSLVILAPLTGLVLVNATYPCPTCTPDPEWCVTFTKGIPFPHAIGQREPSMPPWTDACGILSSGWLFWSSDFLEFGDYFVGLVGLPMLYAYAPRLRGRNAERRT